MELGGFICCIRKSQLYRIQHENEEKTNVEDLVVVNPAVENVDNHETQDQKEDINMKVLAEESEKRELEERLEVLVKDTNELRENIQNEEIERDILRAKLNASNDGEKEKTKKRIEDELKELEMLEQKLKTIQDENKKAELLGRIEDEEQEKRDIVESANLQNKLKLTSEEKIKVLEELFKLEKRIPELNETIKKRSEEVDSLNGNLVGLQKDIEQLRISVDAQEEEKKKLIEKKTYIRNEVEELNKEVKVQESEKNSLSRKHTLQDKGNQSLRVQIAEAKAANEELRKRCDEREKENEQLVEASKDRENDEKLEIENKNLLRKLREAEKERDNLRTSVELLTKEKDESNKKNGVEDKPYVKADGVFSLPIRVSQPNVKDKDEEGTKQDDDVDKNADSDTPTIGKTDPTNDTTNEDLDEIELAMNQQKSTNVRTEDEGAEKPGEGFISDLELEKIAQSTYRYSYHQFVENYQEDEEEED